MAQILAAADIGSNTAHLLVAATDGEIVMRIDNLNEWIALGEVVARKGQIPKEQIEQLVYALKEFRKVAAFKRAAKIYVFATEAIRSASNMDKVLKTIRSETGIAVEVIPPEMEADYSFYGVRLDTKEVDPDMMFEVGGGSAQVALVTANEILEDVSLPLGTGRVLAESGLENPCPDEAVERAEEYIKKALKHLKLEPPKHPKAIASGGVARGIWRALHPDGEKQIALEELDFLCWSCRRLSLDRIVERFNVKPRRAGTLLPGALIYASIMRKVGAQEIYVSEFGVREGAILQMARGAIEGQTP